MLKSVVSVFDKKTSSFTGISFCEHVGEAIREFDYLRGRTDNKIGMNPEDFQLVKIAEFDPSTGEFVKIKHETLASGV